MERPWETSKVDVPKDHFDLLFTPVACVVSITTDTTDRVNAASFATCVRVHHEPTCIAFCVDSHQFGHPMRTPPGTPMDRVRILREAYSNAMRDPEMIAEAQKARGVIEPVSGEDLVVAKRVMVQSASGRAVQKDFARGKTRNRPIFGPAVS